MSRLTSNAWWLIALPETHALGRLRGPRSKTWRWSLWWKFGYRSSLYRWTWKRQRAAAEVPHAR
jgi:hypothetical protein